jgi:hypothetical protein
MMWRRGRRLFSAAGILLLLTAAAHTAGHFSPTSGPSEDAVLATMDAHRVPLGLGMTPSLLDIFKGLSLTMSIALVAIAAINLTLAASADVSDHVIRRIIWLNVLWTGAFGLLMLVNQILPPLICAVVIEAVLMASLVGPARASA